MSRRQPSSTSDPGGGQTAGGSVYTISSGVKYVVFDAQRISVGLLNPETWAYLWGRLGEVERELRQWEEKARSAAEDREREEARQMAEFMRRRVETAEAASLCCCPERAKAVAEVCIQHLLYSRPLLRLLDFGDVKETQKARFKWLVECVRDGCYGGVERGAGP